MLYLEMTKKDQIVLFVYDIIITPFITKFNGQHEWYNSPFSFTVISNVHYPKKVIRYIR